ncbi:MAG: TonB-dependent receptor [Bacteroidales bacterium]|nr:TonB-dependent receptor [Bacteroidales bacterium]MDD3962328.1 TonB-dependent receptor [Bacteroidales bacterium]
MKLSQTKFKLALNRALLFVAVATMPVVLKAQFIVISANNEPLNKVMIQLRDSAGIQLSFDDALLSTFLISSHQTFPTPEAAIQSLIKDFPLQYEKSGDVFLLFPKKKPVKNYHYRGVVKDKNTGEPLPYSHVKINETRIITDLSGTFSYMHSGDSGIGLTISHLGYFIHDTVMPAPGSHTVNLTPSVIGLQEVIIEGQRIEKELQIGRIAGVMRLNKFIGRHLPGNADNSIYNLLRLQPGIMASGESANDLIIRGAYEGQSEVRFDGFSIFGVKNYNDNVSAVNPLITKDIEIFKSGYNARYGNRVGGIVNITGINGNRQKPTFHLNLNNFTANALLELPLSENSAVIAAFRQTYYNLYSPETYSILRRRATRPVVPADISVFPDYTFKDANIKYSAQNKNGDLFYISLFGTKDDFNYELSESFSQNRRIDKQFSEANHQAGAAIYYGKNWAKGNKSSITVAASGLNTTFSDQYTITQMNPDEIVSERSYGALNRIGNFDSRFEHRMAVLSKYTLEGAVGITSNTTQVACDSLTVGLLNHQTATFRLYGYLQDHLQLGNYITIVPGIRMNYAVKAKRAIPEPRISATISKNQKFILTLAAGRYRQFISKVLFLDAAGNRKYVWMNSDGIHIPVLAATHLVIGSTFSLATFQVSGELFYTHTTGVSRYIRATTDSQPLRYQGEIMAYGLDLYLRKEIKQHTFWVSYTLSRGLEKFPYFAEDEFRRALHDQRHELKAALLINLASWHFSTNYVFGSGQPLPTWAGTGELREQPYSRLDVAATYAFSIKKITLEAGISVLNLLNTENIKYSNYERIVYPANNSITLFAEAIPITPTLNLKIVL